MNFWLGLLILMVWVLCGAALLWVAMSMGRENRRAEAMARHPSAQPWWMPEERIDHLAPTVTDLATGEVVPPQEVPYCACGAWVLKPGHELPTGDGWLHTVEECYSRGCTG